MTSKKTVSSLRILRFIYGFARPHLMLLIVGTLLYCSQTVMFPIMNAALLGGVTSAMLAGDFAELLAAGIRALGLLALTMVMVYPGVLMFVSGGLKTTRHLQTKLFRSFMSANAEDHVHSGERLSALNTDAENAKLLYGNALANVLFNLVPIVTLSAVVFAIEWRIGVFTVFVGLFAMAGQSLFVKPLAGIARGKLSATAETTKTIGDLFAGSVVMRAFALQDSILKLFGRGNDEMRRLIYRESRITGTQKLLSNVSDLFTTGGVFVVGSILVSKGEMTLPALMTVVPMCGSVAWAIASIGEAWTGMQAPLEAGRRVYALLGGDNHLDPLPERNHPVIAEEYALETKNLTFSFPNADHPTLSDVNLSVAKNQLALFIGESGSGKSTLLKVIMGLYECGNFDITIGGKLFSGDSREEWRGYFAYVDQSCKLFNMTIAENIALGKVGATIDEIKAAAVEADAHGFIMALPKGYDTSVGEIGAMLSGGQRQRIAIARALIRRSPILVFDEATSALDKDSEREVIAAINNLRAKHTILIVMHNYSSIQPDITFMVQNGHVSAVHSIIAVV